MIDAELGTLHKNITPENKHRVAWIFGSNEEERSEVLECVWEPNGRPHGTCKSSFVSDSITNLRNTWPWDENEHSDAVEIDQTERWEVIKSPRISGTKSLKWAAKRPFKGGELALVPDQKGMEMFFAFQSFDLSRTTWRAGKSSVESLCLETNCDCDASGCPNLIRRCTQNRKKQQNSDYLTNQIQIKRSETKKVDHLKGQFNDYNDDQLLGAHSEALLFKAQQENLLLRARHQNMILKAEPPKITII